jgi:hypothetical protein
VQVCGYSEGFDARYAAIWSNVNSPAWEARHGLTAAEYQQTFDELVAERSRRVWANGYSASGIARYAGIWEQAVGANWRARHGLNGIQYQQIFNELVNQSLAMAWHGGQGSDRRGAHTSMRGCSAHMAPRRGRATIVAIQHGPGETTSYPSDRRGHGAKRG